jgi:hypothetical protein
VEISGNTVSSPQAYGGAIALEAGSNLRIFGDVALRGNRAEAPSSSSNLSVAQGGAIYVDLNNVLSLEEGAVIEHNRVTADGNGANDGAWGGGIYSAGAPVIDGAIIRHNTAENQSGTAQGGGINMNGWNIRSGTFAYNKVTGVSAQGGGIYVSTSSLPRPGTPAALSGDLYITGNEADGISSDTAGGGIFLTNNQPVNPGWSNMSSMLGNTLQFVKFSGNKLNGSTSVAGADSN